MKTSFHEASHIHSAGHSGPSSGLRAVSGNTPKPRSAFPAGAAISSFPSSDGHRRGDSLIDLEVSAVQTSYVSLNRSWTNRHIQIARVQETYKTQPCH